MKQVAWVILFLVLAVPIASAGTKDTEPPDKEMLRMMDFLREMEMIKQVEMMQDLSQVEQVENSSSSNRVREPSPAKTKEAAK